MRHLFVYGSLLFTEMLEALTGKKFKTEPAILRNYRRFSVLDQDYPAIVKMSNSFVAGKIVFDVDDRSLDVISFFEGDEYELKKVNAESENKSLVAFAFCWKHDLKHLDNKEWDMENFRSESLSFYVNEVAPETRKAFEQDKNSLF